MAISTIIHNVKFGLQVAALGDFMAIHRALSSNRCTQLRSYFGHIGGHLELDKGHVNNTKYAFHRKIYPTPINFYHTSISSTVREHHNLECSGG